MKRQIRLYPKALAALAQLGENIKLARRRRGITSDLQGRDIQDARLLRRSR